MGMFDEILVKDHGIFKCSEGHDLVGEWFQTKDLGCAFAMGNIENQKLILHPRQTPDGDTISIYTYCRQCPCFISENGTIESPWCEFRIELSPELDIDSIVSECEPISKFLEETPKKTWMQGCAGPFPYQRSLQIQQEIAEKKRGSSHGVSGASASFAKAFTPPEE